MKKHSQSGFAIVELVVAVVILAAIAGAGYYVWHHHNHKTVTTTTKTSSSLPSASSQSSSTATPTAPQVNNASDLNSAMQALNQTDVTASNSDSSQLSSQASGF